jgi:hypothetical protein
MDGRKFEIMSTLKYHSDREWVLDIFEENWNIMLRLCAL